MNAKPPSTRKWSRRDDLLVRYVSPAVAAEKRVPVHVQLEGELDKGTMLHGVNLRGLITWD